MSDLFHKDIPRQFVGKVFDTMEGADWHVYQTLTKRSSRLRDVVNQRYPHTPAPSHMWFGVSVEDVGSMRRIDHLKQTNASIRFLSLEPLIGPLGKLDLDGIQWVIVGGESGPGFRPIDINWIREIRDQCLEARVAFFFKQWGGIRPTTGGNLIDGRQWMEYPDAGGRRDKAPEIPFLASFMV
jgi:protein gp37